jgi:hypothetical protein
MSSQERLPALPEAPVSDMQEVMLPNLDRLDADSAIDQYLYLYTKGAELPFGDQNLLLDHKNDTGGQCRIIISRGGRDPMYYVQFTDKAASTAYYRLFNGEMQVESNRQYLGLQEPTELLTELENFFGVLDADTLTSSHYSSAAFRNEVFFKRSEPYGSYGGGGTKSNLGAPEFYEGYKAGQFDDESIAEPITRPAATRPSREDTQRKVQEAQEKVNAEATAIIDSKQLPNEAFEMVKTVVASRKVGLTDKAIYRQLVRKYHPDQAQDKVQAEAMFKVLQQFLYSAEGFSF